MGNTGQVANRVNLGASALISAAMAAAGAMKAWNPAEFLIAIERYELVPGWLALGASFYVPWLEIAIAVGIWPRGFRRVATALAIGLGLVFVAFTWSAYWRGLDVKCGCFGAASDGGGVTAAVRASLFVAVGAAAYWSLCRQTRPN